MDILSIVSCAIDLVYEMWFVSVFLRALAASRKDFVVRCGVMTLLTPCTLRWYVASCFGSYGVFYVSQVSALFNGFVERVVVYVHGQSWLFVMTL
jgi:hypothetical protein